MLRMLFMHVGGSDAQAAQAHADRTAHDCICAGRDCTREGAHAEHGGPSPSMPSSQGSLTFARHAVGHCLTETDGAQTGSTSVALLSAGGHASPLVACHMHASRPPLHER
eukprot:5905998-Alexandrium_andersonii.AAC.1